MLNKEKYAKEIVDIACQGDTIAVSLKGELCGCRQIDCDDCLFCDEEHYLCKRTSINEWANSEYKKREIDWSKVPVDTKVVIHPYNNKVFTLKRYFAKYVDGKIYCWADGATSYSIDADFNKDDENICYSCDNVKIAEGVDCSEWYKD